MARGILSGMIVGTLVSTVGVGALSLLAGPPAVRPAPQAPETSSAEAPQSQVAPVSADAPANLPNSQNTPTSSNAPSAVPPTADMSATLDGTAPAPETGAADEAAVSPEETSQPDIALTDDTPSQTSPAQTAPGLPASESEVAVATETATPKPQPEPTPQPEAASEANADDTPTAELPAALPDDEREEITLEVAPEEPEAAAAPATKPTTKTERASLGTPAKKLGSSQSSRLPSVKVETAQDAENTAENTAENQAEISEDSPPFLRFAQPFKGDANKPKMAIVLIDDGTSNIGIEALTTFPYPLSFAVDTSWKGAPDAMATYRASGFEVLAMVDLPRGARASDVEVALPVMLATLPEAVGVIETPDAGLQDSREVISQVSDFLANSGHGLVLFPKGLNTAQKLAAKQGVPSTTVFRDFDSKGQNASTIKRFLSHAALKAGNEGGVVMVGRLRADTISALLLWGLQDRSDRLELAPVSQLMKVPN